MRLIRYLWNRWFSFRKTLRELPTAEILRYGLWTAPPIIVGIYWLAIRGLGLPIIFPLLTAAAVFYAVYPVECDRLRLLTKSFYYQDGRDLNVSAQLIIGVEALFIILSAQMFSCDCSADNDFWIPALFCLYLGFALLWLQTGGFREMEYGVRRYYFKASLFIGILYSAFVVYDSE